MNTNQEIALEVAREVGARTLMLFGDVARAKNPRIEFFDTNQLLAFVNAYNARLSEPAKPEYFFNKGDEYTFIEDEVLSWAEDSDLVEGDEFELEYFITGTAKFIIQDNDAKLLDYSPKYFEAPQPPKAELTDEYKAYVERLEDALKEVIGSATNQMHDDKYQLYVEVAKSDIRKARKALANKPKVN